MTYENLYEFYMDLLDEAKLRVRLAKNDAVEELAEQNVERIEMVLDAIELMMRGNEDEC